MKHYLRIAASITAIVLFTGAVGPVTCSEQAQKTISDVETQAAAAVAKIKVEYALFKTNLPVYEAKAKAYGQIVCGIDGLLNAGAAQAQANISGAPGVVQSYLSKTVNYSGQVADACGKIAQLQPQASTGSQVADAAIAAWNAYQAGKAALTQATASAAKP